MALNWNPWCSWCHLEATGLLQSHMEPVGAKDSSYVEPFLFYSYHTWTPCESEVCLLLSSLLSLSLCRNGEFMVDLVMYITFGHCRMKYLNGVRLLIVLSSAHVMGGIWVHRCELCIVMLFLQGTYARLRRKPTYWCSSLFLVSLHVGTHPPPSALCKLQSSCSHLAHKCHSRSLISVSLHKIWGCAMDFQFCSLPFSDKSYHSLFQSLWPGIFRQLLTIMSVLFLCMARMISPT